MKTKISIFFLMLAFIATAQTSKKDKPDKSNPPGTIWLKDSLYMDQSEVRNLDYLEYLTYLYKSDIKKYTAALPDTSVWINKETYNQPYMQYYLRHPAYHQYPVVGVSYEQAVEFCAWRTERVKELTKGKFTNIEYRLPGKEEWEYAANARNAGAENGFSNLLSKKNIPKVWVREAWALFALSGADIYKPETAPFANDAGFYHMLGNVGEMVAEKGVFKGGSVFNTLHDCEAKNDQNYSKPLAYLGFRCVCVKGK